VSQGSSSISYRRVRMNDTITKLFRKLLKVLEGIGGRKPENRHWGYFGDGKIMIRQEINYSTVLAGRC
jgi:hypothetical protein